MKYKLKNIANRPIPVEDSSPAIPCGEIVEVELTPDIERLIQNKFFENLGEATSDEVDEKKAPEEHEDKCFVCRHPRNECVCEKENEAKCNVCEQIMSECTCEDTTKTKEKQKTKNRQKRGSKKKNKAPSEEK